MISSSARPFFLTENTQKKSVSPDGRYQRSVHNIKKFSETHLKHHMVCIWIASFKSNSFLDIHRGIKKCFTSELEEKEVCLYVPWTFESYNAKTSLTWALNWLGLLNIERSIDWLVYFLAKKSHYSFRQVAPFSHLL